MIAPWCSTLRTRHHHHGGYSDHQEAHEAVFTEAAKTFVHKLVTTFVGDVDTILQDRKLRKGGRLLSLNRRQNALLVMNLDLDI